MRADNKLAPPSSGRASSAFGQVFRRTTSARARHKTKGAGASARQRLSPSFPFGGAIKLLCYVRDKRSVPLEGAPAHRTSWAGWRPAARHPGASPRAPDCAPPERDGRFWPNSSLGAGVENNRKSRRARFKLKGSREAQFVRPAANCRWAAPPSGASLWGPFRARSVSPLTWPRARHSKAARERRKPGPASGSACLVSRRIDKLPAARLALAASDGPGAASSSRPAVRYHF